METSELVLVFRDQLGKGIGKLRVVSTDKATDRLRQLTASEARKHGEEASQIYEGFGYDFELFDVTGNYQIRPGRTIKPNRLRPKIGRLEPGLHTGFLEIELENIATSEHVSTTCLEVVSRKISYRDDYRGMMNFISDQCIDLLYDVRAAGRMRLAVSMGSQPENLARRFEFLTSELSSDRFRAAMARILSVPHQKMELAETSISLSQLRGSGHQLALQLGKSRNRRKLPEHSKIGRLLESKGVQNPSLPRSIRLSRQVETFDTPENRFVKHVLTSYQNFLGLFRRRLSRSTAAIDQRLVAKAETHIKELDEFLSRSVFSALGEINALPTGSPTLQRRAGYRDVLSSWIRYDMSVALSWQGGEDVYSAGKRDIATLYEYWLFFQLLRLFRNSFDVSSSEVGTLFQRSSDGLSLRLKAGKALTIEGICIRQNRRLKARFSYNLTQGATDDWKTAGSWTRQMRPDYTLTFWPEEFTLSEAEEQELAVHIHFDAKYRVDKITELFGSKNQSLSTEKKEQSYGTYKRADLLKMHAYRDAIRRTEGAYVLYPGDISEQTNFQGFHEILPGLGAFAIRPGHLGQGQGLQEISQFLNEVIEHVCNRTSAREKSSFHLFDSYKAAGIFIPANSRELPERDEQTGLRPPPPDEHSVVVGWFEDLEMVDWYRKSGLYNLRAGSRRGSIRIDPKILTAKHLFLHTHKGIALPGLWKIKTTGPRIFTGNDLIKKGYPGTPSEGSIYAVFDIEPDPFYTNWNWDFPKLSARQKNRSSGAPLAVNLSEILSIQLP